MTVCWLLWAPRGAGRGCAGRAGRAGLDGLGGPLHRTNSAPSTKEAVGIHVHVCFRIVCVRWVYVRERAGAAGDRGAADGQFFRVVNSSRVFTKGRAKIL